MKKIIMLITIMLFLAGCVSNPKDEDILFEKYEAAYSDLLSNDKFESSSNFFDSEVVVNKVKEDEYRIDTIIDNPKVAMYNVQVIAEINSLGIKEYKEVNPSLGIVDQSVYHLIPYQVNQDQGFYEGLVVSGLSDKKAGDVIFEITWTNYAETEQFQEFLKLDYDIDFEEEEVEEVEDESAEDGE